MIRFKQTYTGVLNVIISNYVISLTNIRYMSTGMINHSTSYHTINLTHNLLINNSFHSFHYRTSNIIILLIVKCNFIAFHTVSIIVTLSEKE